PGYMVPAAVVLLDHLPVTTGGKLDRRALPDPGEHTDAGRGEAATPRQRTLLALFREVLGHGTVGVHDDFFRLGGDSITAIQLVNRARAAGLALRVRDVFDRPTVARLAAVAAPSAGTGDPADDPVGDLTPTPLMADLLDRGALSPRFTQTQVLSVPAGLAEDVLADALAALVRHHDALRLRATATALEGLGADAVPGDLLHRGDAA